MYVTLTTHCIFQNWQHKIGGCCLPPCQQLPMLGCNVQCVCVAQIWAPLSCNYAPCPTHSALQHHLVIFPVISFHFLAGKYFLAIFSHFLLANMFRSFSTIFFLQANIFRSYWLKFSGIRTPGAFLPGWACSNITRVHLPQKVRNVATVAKLK